MGPSGGACMCFIESNRRGTPERMWESAECELSELCAYWCPACWADGRWRIDEERRVVPGRGFSAAATIAPHPVPAAAEGRAARVPGVAYAQQSSELLVGGGRIWVPASRRPRGVRPSSEAMRPQCTSFAFS